MVLNYFGATRKAAYDIQYQVDTKNYKGNYEIGKWTNN